ncbi:MAG: DNA repair exonuclease [Clostridiaceae bacterium]|nr:DNA repair exonuclease [Clostridiaceae bacterium]
MGQSVSLIHCADIHMGSPFKSLGLGNYSSDRRIDIKKTFGNIINLALERNVDYLLISGDLYEHDYAGRALIGWINEKLSRLGDKICVLIPGNHDPYTEDSWYRNYSWAPNVRILSSKNPEFRDARTSCYFYGMGFDAYRQEVLSITKEAEIFPEFINICLFHGTVDMPFSQQPYNPVDSDWLLKMGFDYYALGHFHKYDDSLSDKGIINPGSPEPLGFDEQGEHGVFFVRLSKNEGQVVREYERIVLQQRKYHDIDFDVSGISDSIQLKSALLEALNKKASKSDLVRINLTGRLKSGFYTDLKETGQSLAGEYYFVNIKDSTKPDYNLTELAMEKNITGVFIRMMQDRIESSPESERQLLMKALYLGIEALLTGSVEI